MNTSDVYSRCHKLVMAVVPHSIVTQCHNEVRDVLGDMASRCVKGASSAGSQYHCINFRHQHIRVMTASDIGIS